MECGPRVTTHILRLCKITKKTVEYAIECLPESVGQSPYLTAIANESNTGSREW